MYSYVHTMPFSGSCGTSGPQNYWAHILPSPGFGICPKKLSLFPGPWFQVQICLLPSCVMQSMVKLSCLVNQSLVTKQGCELSEVFCLCTSSPPPGLPTAGGVSGLPGCGVAGLPVLPGDAGCRVPVRRSQILPTSCKLTAFICAFSSCEFQK